VRDRARLWAWLLAAGLAWLVLYPLLLVMVDGLREPGGWTLHHVDRFVSRPGEWQALWASLWLSLASVVLSAAVGVPLAFLFERVDFPGRAFLGVLVALPAVLPPLVGVIAFLFLYGETGFTARFVQWLLRLDEPPWRLAGLGDSPRARLFDVCVFLPVLPRGPRAARRFHARGGPGTGRRSVADPAERRAAPSPAGIGGRFPPHLHDLPRFIQRAVHLRGRV
jgi:hypothetical protein